MNQERIGKFIADRRKLKGLTQEQLAEELGVTKNAVSKWERGICLMDMSLLKPLSKLLDISINEILSGEELSKDELKNKADENIVNLTELYDLKAIKNGVIAFTGVLLFLLIYLSKKDMDTLPIIIIWFIYNLSYYLNKYKFTKDKKEILIAIVFGIGLIATATLFFVKNH